MNYCSNSDSEIDTSFPTFKKRIRKLTRSSGNDKFRETSKAEERKKFVGKSKSSISSDIPESRYSSIDVQDGKNESEFSDFSNLEKLCDNSEDVINSYSKNGTCEHPNNRLQSNKHKFKNSDSTKSCYSLHSGNACACSNIDGENVVSLNKTYSECKSNSSICQKTFMEDGGHSISPAADGYFPKPLPGQTLVSFLSSDIRKTNAELDRENAHFTVSEALISAMEQMQFEKWLREFKNASLMAEDSDEEIKDLQQKLSEKKRQKQQRTNNKETELNNTKCESTTDYSMYESPRSSEHSESECTFDCDSDNDIATLSCNTECCSERNILEIPSAENVALNLLRHFNEKQLPKASDIQWLVSEQDVPQKLLPLPCSIPVSPDDAEDCKNKFCKSQLRGTTEWAPPRPQLVLTLHQNLKHKDALSKQNWRCAGCGQKVSKKLSRYFKFCNYLGRYFCTTCHLGKKSIIPAMVIQKWNFKEYPVSTFSFELLVRMKSDPLFHISSLNPQLYNISRKMHHANIVRLQLYYTVPYIKICKHAPKEQEMLLNFPSYIYSDPYLYSLEDFISVRSGKLMRDMKDLIVFFFRHIARCMVCQGRGFFCEICQHEQVIFPFQIDIVIQCKGCCACYHRTCFSPTSCPKCLRFMLRKSEETVNTSGNIT